MTLFGRLRRLSVRRQVDTQRVADQVWGDTSLFAHPNFHAVILIHGYNTHEEGDNGAQAAYQGWYDSVSAKLPDGAWPTNTAVFGFYWPGDVGGRVTLARFKSALTFGHRIGVATQAGERLGVCLRQQGPASVTLIAHSLGCRVALTALRDTAPMRSFGTLPKVNAAILMAGAVSESSCRASIDPDASSDASPEFAPNIVAPGRFWNLYSTQDSVLALAYPAAASADGDTHPCAIGYRGGPRGRWQGGTFSTNLPHNGYWMYVNGHQLGANAVSPRWARSPLQAGGLPDRKLPKRSLG